MSDKPTPPDGVPNYIADGLQRQGVGTLRSIIQYCEELIAYLEEPPDEGEITESDDVVDVEEKSSGTIVKKMVKCGAGCECNDGEGHGPYKYKVSRDGNGGQDWEYLGKA